MFHRTRVLYDQAPSPEGGSLLGVGAPAPTPKPDPTPTPTPTPEGRAPADWRASLPEAIRENADLSRYKSVEELGNAYINLRKHQSGEKLVLPGKNATEEDWKKVYTKLGLPEKVEEYKLTAAADADPEFVKGITAKFHETGVLPKQAESIVAWLQEQGNAISAKGQEALKAQVNENVTALQKEWGQAFDRNLAASRKVVATFSKEIPELAALVADPALGTNPAFIKFLNKVSTTLWKEDAFKDGGTGSDSVYSPTEARKRTNDIMGDKSHPYWNKEHPNHKAAVKEVQDLIQAQTQKV
jgi:hypothetical protein